MDPMSTLVTRLPSASSSTDGRRRGRARASPGRRTGSPTRAAERGEDRVRRLAGPAAGRARRRLARRPPDPGRHRGRGAGSRPGRCRRRRSRGGPKPVGDVAEALPGLAGEELGGQRSAEVIRRRAGARRHGQHEQEGHPGARGSSGDPWRARHGQTVIYHDVVEVSRRRRALATSVAPLGEHVAHLRATGRVTRARRPAGRGYKSRAGSAASAPRARTARARP